VELNRTEEPQTQIPTVKLKELLGYERRALVNSDYEEEQEEEEIEETPECDEVMKKLFEWSNKLKILEENVVCLKGNISREFELLCFNNRNI
jgi:hypothetical protein